MLSFKHKDFQTIDMNWESWLNIVDLDSLCVQKTYTNRSLNVYSAVISLSSD